MNCSRQRIHQVLNERFYRIKIVRDDKKFYSGLEKRFQKIRNISKGNSKGHKKIIINCKARLEIRKDKLTITQYEKHKIMSRLRKYLKAHDFKSI